MAGTGVLVNEHFTDFPAITKPGSGKSGPRRTDVDVALEQLVAMGQVPSVAVRLIDYNTDAEGEAVEPTLARQRAHARVQALRKRGYTKEEGWRIAAIDGNLWAQYFGPGNHPVKETKESAGENGSA